MNGAVIGGLGDSALSRLKEVGPDCPGRNSQGKASKGNQSLAVGFKQIEFSLMTSEKDPA
jgi:hypothetical protein